MPIYAILIYYAYTRAYANICVAPPLPAQEKERTAARTREKEKELERAQREREAREREAQQQVRAASASVTYILIRVYMRTYAHIVIYEHVLTCARHPLPGKRGECVCRFGQR